MTVYPLVKSSIIDLRTATNHSKHVATGFFIKPDIIVTASHAVLKTGTTIPEDRIIAVYYRDGSANSVELSLIGSDIVNDLAVLKSPISLSPLSWGSSRDTAIGEKIYAIGDLLNEDPRALCTGFVRDNKMTLTTDPMAVELLDLDMSIGGVYPVVLSSMNLVGLSV